MVELDLSTFGVFEPQLIVYFDGSVEGISDTGESDTDAFLSFTAENAGTEEIRQLARAPLAPELQPMRVVVVLGV